MPCRVSRIFNNLLSKGPHAHKITTFIRRRQVYSRSWNHRSSFPPAPHNRRCKNLVGSISFTGRQAIEIYAVVWLHRDPLFPLPSRAAFCGVLSTLLRGGYVSGCISSFLPCELPPDFSVLSGVLCVISCKEYRNPKALSLLHVRDPAVKTPSRQNLHESTALEKGGAGIVTGGCGWAGSVGLLEKARYS